jgi:hypothetical protein
MRSITVSLTATTPAPTAGTYVASADIAATPTNFYVTGVADTVTSYVAVKLSGPNYLRCLKGISYATDYMSNDLVVYDYDVTYTCYNPLLTTQVNTDGKSPTLLTV